MIGFVGKVPIGGEGKGEALRVDALLYEKDFFDKFHCHYTESIIPLHDIRNVRMSTDDLIDSDNDGDSPSLPSSPLNSDDFDRSFTSSRPFISSVIDLFSPSHSKWLVSTVAIADTQHPCMGYVLIAIADIHKGTPLCVYSGEESPSSHNDATSPIGGDLRDDYILEGIDAFRYGGVGRFLMSAPTMVGRRLSPSSVSTIDHPLLDATCPHDPSTIATANVHFQRVSLPMANFGERREKYDVAVGITNRDIAAGEVLGFTYWKGGGDGPHAHGGGGNEWWKCRRKRFPLGPLLITKYGEVIEHDGNYSYDEW